jgi:hypothetical protein
MQGGKFAGCYMSSGDLALIKLDFLLVNDRLALLLIRCLTYDGMASAA